ncbi:2TM domain-containing protein [Flavobacterium sp.]|uniref:2TM domain-containing protein n=1 Tax=Flavobacterium sp. TaxID=239 RepID=UPI0026369F2D|nr:2TM domain-containing protein [Flavobacterium sp.]
MDKEQQELYENARKRLRQKKNVYFHFVLLVIGSLFMFIANIYLEFGAPNHWYIWAVTVWVFLFVLHFIKVFITDRFMNKDWEREQIQRLVEKQQQKIDGLKSKISNE